MTNGPATIVQKLWNYCNALRDDGMSYGDYVELFLFLMDRDAAGEGLVTKADMRNNPCSEDSRPDRVSLYTHEPLRKWVWSPFISN
jgi:type I restriction-modification system DNA methylase subunit